MIKKIAPRNLLDNSDFRNPVNQRGSTSYSTESKYCIDRWIQHGAGTLTIVANEGINIVSSGGFNGILQIIENGVARLASKTVTMAAMVTESSESFAMMMANGTAASYIGYGTTTFTEAGLCVVSVTLPETLENEYLGFFIGEGSTGAAAGANLKIAWCALYEGEYTAETLPDYQPKGYATELTECLRYYQYYNSIGLPVIAWGNSTTQAAISLMMPVPMRIAGVSVTMSTPEVFIDGNGNAKTLSSYSLLNPNQRSCSVRIRTTASTAWTKGDVGVLIANIELSADL